MLPEREKILISKRKQGKQAGLYQAAKQMKEERIMKKVIMKKGVCGSILMVLILSFLSSACSKHADNGSGKNAATLLIDVENNAVFYTGACS